MNPPPIPPVLRQPQELLIRFSIDRWDLIRCRLWVLAHNRVNLLITLAFCFGFPLLDLQNPEMASRSLGFKLFSFVIFAALTLVFMTVVQVVVQLLWMLLNKNTGVLGAHELEIRDEGLVERTNVNESMFRWSGFHKIGSTRKFIFIFVTDNNVQYVPIRCFAATEEAKKFQEEVRRRWLAASQTVLKS